jgi:hypothetical protein
MQPRISAPLGPAADRTSRSAQTEAADQGEANRAVASQRSSSQCADDSERRITMHSIDLVHAAPINTGAWKNEQYVRTRLHHQHHRARRPLHRLRGRYRDQQANGSTEGQIVGKPIPTLASGALLCLRQCHHATRRSVGGQLRRRRPWAATPALPTRLALCVWPAPSHGQ